MKEAVINIGERIAGLQFDQPALEANFAQMGKPVQPDFHDAMRRGLGQYAEVFRKDLRAYRIHKVSVENIRSVEGNSLAKGYLVALKMVADRDRADLKAIRKAFELLGQEKAVLDVELAVASNLIMEGLGNSDILKT